LICLRLLAIRSQLVIDSAAADLPSPIDTRYLQFRDEAGLRAECPLVRELGFGAKAYIHPAQVDVAREAFAPTADELTWAAAIVAGFDQTTGAAQGVIELDGAMIDAPVVARARPLLASADTGESPA
jgi:citrate lyase subunit beta / citryl-CoA lyase